MYLIPQKQLSLADISEDCKNIYKSDKPRFLTLLENHIDINENLASMLLFDTSGIKVYVAENNPKHTDLLVCVLSQLLTVIAVDKINQRQYIRSLKSFIA
jgi:hypothetical protein